MDSVRMGIGDAIRKLLYGVFVGVVMVPSALFAFLLFYLFMPYIGLEAMGEAKKVVVAPLCIAFSMALWVHLAHTLNDRWGIRRVGPYLVYISLVLGLYFGYLAVCREVLLPEMEIVSVADADLGDAWLNLVYAMAGVLGVLLFGKSASRGLQTARSIEHLKAVPPSEASCGLTEVVGELMVDGGARLRSPLEGTLCAAWWEYESRRNDDGRYWHGTGSNHLDLYCGDDHRRLRIAYDQATFSGGRWKENGDAAEKTFLPGDRIYAFGEACIDPQRPGSLVLTADPESRLPLLVSTHSEKKVLDSMSRSCLDDVAWTLCSAAVTLSLILPLVDLAGVSFRAFAALTPVVIFFLGLGLLYVNDLAILRNIALRNRAHLAVSLQKRRDLLPQLEEVVRTHLAHECSESEQVAHLQRAFRDRLEEQAEAFRHYCDAESGALDEVLAILEDHPHLQSNSSIRRLVATWVGLGNEVALLKTGYNQAVAQYLNRRGRFPDQILAVLLGFRRLPLLEADIRERAMPEYAA